MHKHGQQSNPPNQGLVQMTDTLLALTRHGEDHRLNRFQARLAR
jgi:hypothetical protein